jgi:hypothetical protein
LNTTTGRFAAQSGAGLPVCAAAASVTRPARTPEASAAGAAKLAALAMNEERGVFQRAHDEGRRVLDARTGRMDSMMLCLCACDLASHLGSP